MLLQCVLQCVVLVNMKLDHVLRDVVTTFQVLQCVAQCLVAVRAAVCVAFEYETRTCSMVGVHFQEFNEPYAPS